MQLARAAEAPPVRAHATAAWGKTCQYCGDNPRPPRYTPLSRLRLPRDQRRQWKHCVTSSLATVRRTAEGGLLW
jgi:hypothetical protein